MVRRYFCSTSGTLRVTLMKREGQQLPKYKKSLTSKHKKITKYDIGNPGPGLVQALKCSRVKQGQKDPKPFLIYACRRKDGRNGWRKKEEA